MKPHPLLASLLVLSLPAPAQDLTHVRIATPDAAALALRLERDGFDVVEGSVRRGVLELVVSPASREILENEGFALETLAAGRPYSEIQRELLAQSPDAVPAGYLTLAQIVAQMNSTAAAFPAICKVVDLTAAYGVAPTWENRHIHAIKVSDNVNVEEDEPAFLLVSDYHAREIVTPVIALHALSQLTSLYASNPTVQGLVDGHEIWIAPVWNPDGYEYVFNVNNLWRKNRRNNGGGIFGVDLNRNHSFGWSAPCAGSTSTSSDTYKGPAASSEPEVQTMIPFTVDQRFAKVVDYHSFGQEVLWAYACLTNPWATSFWQPEAIALSNASGYGGQNRPPSADGEHYEWQLARGVFAFLIETHTSFQPSYASAQSESALLWPGVQHLLQRPVSLSGHVTDACSGAPLAANVTLSGVVFANGESMSSGGAFGRYDLVLKAGSYTAQFSAAGYQPASFPITVTGTSAQALNVALTPSAVASVYCTPKVSSSFCVPSIGFAGAPSIANAAGFTVTSVNLEANKNGLTFFSTTGANNVPFQGGVLCAKSPLYRLAVQSTGGSAACSGSLAYTLADMLAHPAGGGLIGAGQQVNCQTWFRDPGSPSTTGLSDGLEFDACP